MIVGGFIHRERVRWAELDAFRHVNNVVFQHYFENAWIEYRTLLGIFGDPFVPEFVGMVLASFHIDYRAPVGYGETVEIGLRVTDLRRSSLRADFQMNVGDRLCAEGYGIYVGFDPQERRALPLPEDFRAKLAAESASSTEREKPLD